MPVRCFKLDLRYITRSRRAFQPLHFNYTVGCADTGRSLLLRPENERSICYMEVSSIVALYVQVIEIALPIAIVFWVGDFLVTRFLSAAFGGRLTFRS